MFARHVPYGTEHDKACGGMSCRRCFFTAKAEKGAIVAVVTITDLNMPMSYEVIRPRLFTKLRNTENSREVLVDVPYMSFGDLSLTCDVLIGNVHSEDKDERASFPVTNKMLFQLGMGFDELMRDAQENSQKMFPAAFVPLGAMMNKLVGLNDSEANGYNQTGLFVITTNVSSWGAAALFYPGQLQKIAETLRENYYVLPSSVHEFLILPESGLASIGGTPDQLYEIVRSVNESVVEQEDFLSNSVYYYDAETSIFRTVRRDKDEGSCRIRTGEDRSDTACG